MLIDRFTRNANCEPCAPKPDERYSRNPETDFIECINKWFQFLKGLEKDTHPEAKRALMRFIYSDLQSDFGNSIRF